MISEVRHGFYMLLVTSLLATCALRRQPDCVAISASTAKSGEIIRRTEAVLSSVSQARVTDVCAAHAAIDATLRLDIRENLVFLRDVVRMAYGASDRASDPQLVEIAAHALTTLALMNDAEAVPLARRMIDGPASVAGSAAMSLRHQNDWESTSSVANRLVRDPDPKRDYSLVWLGLEFLHDSPQAPADGCAVIERTKLFSSLSAAEQRNPTMARIEELRTQLAWRYRCSAAE